MALPIRSVTALVADDDADARDAMCSLLVSEGYEVISLADGGAALEYLAEAADGKRASPDFLVLDFAMPGLSGIGLLRVLRRFGTVPPTILVTAFPDPSVDTFARAAGATRVLRKPVESEDVLAAVCAALIEGRGKP